MGCRPYFAVKHQLKDCAPLRLSVNLHTVLAEANQHARFIYWLEVMFTLMHRITLLFPCHMPCKIAT